MMIMIIIGFPAMIMAGDYQLRLEFLAEIMSKTENHCIATRDNDFLWMLDNMKQYHDSMKAYRARVPKEDWMF